MDNWKDLFERKILDRGRVYYEDECIEHYAYRHGTINAIVCGSEDYEVEIQIENGMPIEMDCSCPYAYDWGNCKHMAAVLYKWENDGKTETFGNSTAETYDIHTVLDKADEKTVKSFLAELFKENKQLFMKFVKELPKGTAVSRDYKKEIDVILASYSDRYDRVDNRDVDDMVDELLSYRDEIEEMTDNGQYLEAFDLLYYLLETADSLDYSDTEYGINGLYNETGDLWKKIPGKADEKSREILFWKMLEISKNLPKNTELENYVHDTICREFLEDKYVPVILDYLEQKINACREDYQKNTLLIEKLDMMNQVHYSMRKIENYCQQYRQSRKVKEWLAKTYAVKEQYDKAIALYEEMAAADQSYFSSDNYSNELLELYQKTDNTQKYREKLCKIVERGTAYDYMSYYRRYKVLFSEQEWREEREKIFKNLDGNRRLAEVYCEEKLYDRLMALCSENFTIAFQYENILAKLYPKEVLAVYEQYLRSKSTEAWGREAYREWVKQLNHMLDFEGGRAIAVRLADEWKANYKNRKAMMEELKKFKG